MPALAAVFDVDGVLVDSLPAHIETCEQLSREYGLALAIPSVSAFCELVRRGVPISPMRKFFEVVGFSGEFARRAEVDYEASFALRFSPPLFAGVREMLGRLHAAGVELGIVTANTRANIEKALGSTLEFFPPERIFTRDHAHPRSKAEALEELVSMLALPRQRIFYIGDQLTDAAAARQVGLPFLGATYGWGIQRPDPDDVRASVDARFVDSPVGIAEHLLTSHTLA